jgi:hypothetical protein
MTVVTLLLKLLFRRLVRAELERRVAEQPSSVTAAGLFALELI